MPEEKRFWIITVAGWGSRALYGTEAEAEEWRAHKAQWEGGVGRKRPADLDDPEHLKLVREYPYLECPCCGCEAKMGDADGKFWDGDASDCGCAGWVSVDEGREAADGGPLAYFNLDDSRECPPHARCREDDGV